MEQRPLRLGDLVDDYCPRERRLTNHAIVAIVGDDIKQTRCNTCEAEHVFKGGKVPVRKKKDPAAALYDQVLANVTAGTVAATPVSAPVVVAAPPPVVLAAPPPAPEPTPAPEAELEPAPQVDEGWTLHRTLIRASLPRNENHVPTPRPIPEFTMHQRNVRGSQMFRSGGPSHDRQANGHGPVNGRDNGHSRGSGFRSEGSRGDSQPGAGGPDAPNGHRPPGSGRRRRRSKKPRPVI